MTRLIALNAYVLVFALWSTSAGLQAQVPDEPMEIGHEPQLFLDDWLVDNHFGLQLKNEAITRTFHRPRKYEGNPVLPGEGGYCSVVRDPESGIFHLLYQTAWSADGDRASTTTRWLTQAAKMAIPSVCRSWIFMS